MKHCDNCKWSEKYFRGLLCHWIEKNSIGKLPAYLQIVGDPQYFCGIESCFPKMIDENDYAEHCDCFEAK